jgi:hypothetical protein
MDRFLYGLVVLSLLDCGGLLFVFSVPESFTLPLLAIGTLGFIGWAWRRGVVS